MDSKDWSVLALAQSVLSLAQLIYVGLFPHITTHLLICWSEYSDSSLVYGFMSLDYGLGTMTTTTYYHSFIRIFFWSLQFISGCSLNCFVTSIQMFASQPATQNQGEYKVLLDWGGNMGQFVVFLCSGFRLPLSLLLCFAAVFIIICISMMRWRPLFRLNKFVIWCCIRIKGEVSQEQNWFKHSSSFSSEHSQVVSLLQFLLCASVVSCVAFVLLLFVPCLFFFGKAVLRDFVIFWVYSLIFFNYTFSAFRSLCQLRTEIYI